MLSLFYNDKNYKYLQYGAFVTSLDLSMVDVWCMYRGRAYCENRIKELKIDFGLDAFNLNGFY